VNEAYNEGVPFTAILPCLKDRGTLKWLGKPRRSR
jgi:hypothetical protein